MKKPLLDSIALNLHSLCDEIFIACSERNQHFKKKQKEIIQSWKSDQVETIFTTGMCRSVTAKPTYIKKEKDIPRLPEI